jgi:flavin reductase (DIM6/NTAB) family NADH-FMN oxidoreductase RutF
MPDSALRAPIATEDDAERRDFLRGMRLVAGSVAVVTTDGPAGRQAATVSAFCSVSADPPTLLACLHAASRAASAIAINGAFTLNILPEADRALAVLFSGRAEEDRAACLAGLPMLEGGALGPRFPGATSFACRVIRAELQHTHRLFIGAVAAVALGDPRPLLYHDGAYSGVRRAPMLIDA